METIQIKGGLITNWEGKPAPEMDDIFTPSRLEFPIRTPRFQFTDLHVQDGQSVQSGDTLATAPGQSQTPLLAPLGGRVEVLLDDRDKPARIILTDLQERETHRDGAPTPPEHANPDTRHLDHRRIFRDGGGWPMLRTFPGDTPPDLEAHLNGVVVTCYHPEPFRPEAAVLLQDKIAEFALGLESLQAMFTGYQKIYLVLCSRQQDADWARQLEERVRGYAWLETILLKNAKYPHGHPGAVLQKLGVTLSRETPYWCMDAQAVLAMHRALVTHRPCLSRIITLGGPGVKEPRYIRAYPGTPLRELLEGQLVEAQPDDPLRVIQGGLFTGFDADLAEDCLDLEADALTIAPSGTHRQFLGFMRPGFRDHSVMRTLASPLFPLLEKKLDTSANGELRACVQCNHCENICPVDYLMPYLFHRYQPLDMLDELEKAGIWKCIECGCCSYVCPSKIPLQDKINQAKAAIIEDLEEMEED